MLLGRKTTNKPISYLDATSHWLTDIYLLKLVLKPLGGGIKLPLFTVRFWVNIWYTLLAELDCLNNLLFATTAVHPENREIILHLWLE